MHFSITSAVVFLIAASDALAANFNLKSFAIDLSAKSLRMKALVANTILPSQPEYPSLGDTFGIDLDVLKSLQKTWSSNYGWAAQEEKFNKYKHYTATIEGLTIHFIHEKSDQNDSIPLILNHGWPGTFQDFLPLVPSLKSVSTTPSGKKVSFDVIIPSLPGFTFSSAPPVNWTTDDTARVFNTLMTEVLGYETYSVFGTDWGCVVGYAMYSTYNTSVRALMLDFLPFIAMSRSQLAENNVTLDAFGEVGYDLYAKTLATGTGYYVEQRTEPNTLGLALYDNPVGQLAWIGSKILSWSDPRAGTNGSLINPETILNTVSLYFLTDSSLSSVFIYAQNPTGFKNTYSKANTDAPLLFSAFQYNSQFWPREVVAMVGNLVSYTEHDFGGHFAGLDNPSGLLSDLIKIGDHFDK